ncbi:hypothetical protein [Niveibacterium sp.]|uniref:hypothetical protein n=1 Tax=Niveibacterium sp. TaxID=2017444 RepID=UPI0035B20FE9
MSNAPVIERRTDSALRAKVDAAYAMIAPFFDPSNQWAGRSQDMLAYRTLRDRMPELDANQAHLIVSVARRMARERGQPS